MGRGRRTEAKEVPDKLFFKIGEVAEIAGIKPHVLRFWEEEFGLPKPIKSRTGHRVYRQKDVETVLQIRKLLYEEGYTISGAKKKLFHKNKLMAEEIKSARTAEIGDDKLSLLSNLKANLRSILDILENNKNK